MDDVPNFESAVVCCAPASAVTDSPFRELSTNVVLPFVVLLWINNVEASGAIGFAITIGISGFPNGLLYLPEPLALLQLMCYHGVMNKMEVLKARIVDNYIPGDHRVKQFEIDFQYGWLYNHVLESVKQVEGDRRSGFWRPSK